VLPARFAPNILIQVRDNLPLSMLTGRRKRLPDERAQ